MEILVGMVDQRKFLVFFRMYQKNEFLYPEKSFPTVHDRGFSENSLFSILGVVSTMLSFQGQLPSKIWPSCHSWKVRTKILRLRDGGPHSSQSDSFLNICQVSPSSRGWELLFMMGLIIMPRIWRGKGEEGLGNHPTGGQKWEKVGVYNNWNKEGKIQREIFFFLGGI